MFLSNEDEMRYYAELRKVIEELGKKHKNLSPTTRQGILISFTHNSCDVELA